MKTIEYLCTLLLAVLLAAPAWAGTAVDVEEKVQALFEAELEVELEGGDTNVARAFAGIR